jgi:hypothetical protein
MIIKIKPKEPDQEMSIIWEPGWTPGRIISVYKPCELCIIGEGECTLIIIGYKKTIITERNK